MASRQTRYSEETRRRAVRLYRQRIDGDERTDWQRLVGVAEKLGMTPETLRRWVREAEIEAGERPGAPSAEEVAELRRRNAELELTVEILKAATSFFARECDPRPASSASSSPSIEPGSESHRSVER
jgi:transposase